MKKLLFLLVFGCSLSLAANAQEKTEVKKTTTPVQKVANPFRKHKRYKGYKVKHTHHGVTHKTIVDTKHGSVKTKADQ